MIYKSFIVEENINLLEDNLSLIYGENLGLINDIKKKIIEKNSKTTILRLYQNDILSNKNLFLNEIFSISLFEEKKIIFINDATDKILNILTSNLDNLNNNKIYLFAGMLEKKSKLRNFFENENNVSIVPCYKDNDHTLKNVILKSLKEYKGLNNFNLNMILEHSNYDRTKVKNEISKIKNFFTDKLINNKDLEKLLNFHENTDFENVRDASISGNKIKTNKLLSSTLFEDEKISLYLGSINQRFKRLLEIIEMNIAFEKAIESLKPPIFWKDKPTIIMQAKIWNIKNINKIFSLTYDLELKIKSSTISNKKLIFKKLFIDICNLANAA